MSKRSWNDAFQDRDGTIPENIKRLMPREEQERIGYKPTPAPPTAEEIETGETPELRKAERKLQEQIRAYLWGQHGHELIIPPMVKKSALPEGWPDITFAFYGRAVALEVKTKDGRCTKEQLERHEKMRAHPNYWHVEIVRSVEDVKRVLETLASERKNGHGWASAGLTPSSKTAAGP